MIDGETNVIKLDDHRRETDEANNHSKRATADHRRWLEIWAEAWNYESARRGKTLPANERIAMASHVRRMVDDINRPGRRSGKVVRALVDASQITENEARNRGCPVKLLEAACASREYRIDRFINTDPKKLRGKLSDWLRVTEALAQVLKLDPKREVILLFDESRKYVARGERSALSDDYDRIFEELSGHLMQIATKVARECDFATYYECCDKMHAGWSGNDIVEDDGWYHRFKSKDFEQSGWVEIGDDGDRTDPAARSPLGIVGEILIHTPLARMPLAYAEITDTMREGGMVGERVSLDLGIHLALRPDVDDPREAGALLLHPMITTFDADLVHPSGTESLRWWSSLSELSLENISDAAVNELIAGRYVGGDQHVERGIELARSHIGQIRLIPLSGAACQAWLSFGSNTATQEFAEFFWHEAGLENASETVSAPSGTLAGYIQRNLVAADANGEAERRIDRLLKANAERKTTALTRLLARKRTNYAAGLSAAGF